MNLRMADDRLSMFSEVDATSEPKAFVEYLDFAAAALGERRRLRYPLLGLRPGDAVLDAGCGAGEVCVDLRELVGSAGRVVGIDASALMIDTARTRVTTAEFEVADITALPYDDNTFDAARSERVLQHLDDPQAAVGELARVVRPGGRVMLIDPDHFQIDVATDRHDIFVALQAHSVGSVRNPQSGIRSREWLRSAHLDVVELIAAPLEFTWERLRTLARLDEAIDVAINADTITRSDAQWFIAEQDARSEAGTFHSTGVGYTAVGSKPN
jgi:ubiquinone/menaquinone biosynthesis C-methylase UbiE